MARVGAHYNAARQPLDGIVPAILESGQPVVVETNVAQDVGCELALGIKALVLPLEIHALEVQRAHTLGLLVGNLPLDPAESAGGIKTAQQVFLFQSEHWRKKPRDHSSVGNLCRHGEHRVHGKTHGERVHVAVENRSPIGSYLNSALLLLLGPAHQVDVFNDLKIVETANKCDHPYGKYSAQHQAPFKSTRPGGSS